MTSPELHLNEPAIAETAIRPEFASDVAAQVHQTLDYLSASSDEVPYGFVQRDAYTAAEEQERDYYVEQLSEALGYGTHGLDEAMTAFEERWKSSQPVLEGHKATVAAPTVRLEPWMKQRLELDNPDTASRVQGGVIRGAVLPGQDDRRLSLWEIEVPNRVRFPDGTEKQRMNRIVYFTAG